jgi:hypothetical protein
VTNYLVNVHATIQTDDLFAVDELSLHIVQIFRNPASPGVPRTLETEFNKEIFPKFAVGIIFNYITLAFLIGIKTLSKPSKFE